MVKSSRQDQVEKVVFVFGKFSHCGNLGIGESPEVFDELVIIEPGDTLEPDMERNAVAFKLQVLQVGEASRGLSTS